MCKNHFLLASFLLLIGVFLIEPMTLSAQTLTDPLNLAVVAPQARMDQVGWPILAGRNGGWGRFPDYYSYKRVEFDGRACLIDSYPHSQVHGSSNAIMLDWDGDPANGMTPLVPKPGMVIQFNVTVFIQPWTHNTMRTSFVRDGTRMVQWRMGPGRVPENFKPVKDTKKHPNYSWQIHRGPRIGYRMGDVPGHDPAKKPVFETFSALRKEAIGNLELDKAGQWCDLQLSVTFNDNLTAATCHAKAKAADQKVWQQVGEAWEIAILQQSQTADNPACWNALILDMPHAQWSTKGYGKPDSSMLDRYSQFSVTLQNAGSTGPAKRCELMHFKREKVARRMTVPSRVFLGEPLDVSMEIVNAGDEILKGEILLSINDQQHVMATNWTLPLDQQWQKTKSFVPTYQAKPMAFSLIHRKPDGSIHTLVKTQCQVLERRRSTPLDNVMRNASFELPAMFNGQAIRRGQERYYTYAKAKGKRVWSELPVEGWWSQAPNSKGISLARDVIHSGQQSLKLDASNEKVIVVSAPGSWLPKGDVTISAWVKTQNAKATLELDLLNSDQLVLPRRATIRKKIKLQENQDWTRVTLSLKIKESMQALVRIITKQGQVWIDDVQVQPDAKASDFNLRVAEWIRLDLIDVDSKIVPQWIAGQKQERVLTLVCDSRQQLSGSVMLTMGLFDKLGEYALAEVNLSELANGKVLQLPFSTSQLKPGAYVITADYHAPNEKVYLGREQFDSSTRIGGRVSNSMLFSRQAMRFAIIPDYEPAKIFGVGNGMLDTNGDHFGGYSIDDYQWAGQLNYICDRGRYNANKGYLIAAGGMPTHRMETRRLDVDYTKNRAIQNPAKPGRLDLNHPQGREVFLQQARDIGKENGSNPQIASYQMANEQPFYAKDGLCPSVYADAAFRDWCKQLHGDLSTLNKRWGTKYSTWDQVEQPLSASQLQLVKNQDKLKGADAIAWTAVYGKISKQVQNLITSIPGRGLDWYRWRTAFSLQMFKQFRHEARKADHKTLYSTNLCWPNFWPQLAMPFFRAMDVTMLDLEYSAGQKRGLGTPAEMMEIMEMFESNAPDKPIWGIEVYTQPQWSAASAALQNWGLLAHGMTNNLVFGWRPYSDHGRVKGIRAWEKSKAHPMWFLIDNDGTRLPSFDAVEKSKREIHAFHKQFDGLSLKRYPTRMAIYVSDDTSEYLSYLTANKPYATGVTHSRNTLIYLMRMAGLQVDYLDDELLTLKRKQYDTLVLPPTPLLSRKAAVEIADFVQRGGKLILVGASGQYDPWLNAQVTLGGQAWKKLGWQAPDYQHTALQKGAVLHGQNIGQFNNGQTLTDKKGRILGWQKSWGKGQVFAMAVYPSTYAKTPHMPLEANHWMQRLIDHAKLPINARWINHEATSYDPKHKHGNGAPVVEVVLRRKSEHEIFAFVLNQGGAGHGLIECQLPETQTPWEVHDALTGAQINASSIANRLQIPLTLQPWGYRVLLLKR